MDFPNGFRRCIFALWIPLELNCAPKDERKALVSQMMALMSEITGKTYEEFRKEAAAEVKNYSVLGKDTAPATLWPFKET